MTYQTKPPQISGQNSAKVRRFFLAFLLLILATLACGLFDRFRGTDEMAQTQVAESEVQDDPTATPTEAQRSVAPAMAIDTTTLRDAVTIPGLRQHLTKLQEIAAENNGVRTSGTPGFDASAEYVRGQLEMAGYGVALQSFEFPFFHDATQLEQLAPEPITYTYFSDFATLTFSPAGEATAPIQSVALRDPIRGSSTSGCHSDDFADFESGNIALIKRGICPFAEKAGNAEAAGARAVLIFNDGAQPNRERVIRGTLGEAGVVGIPVVGLSFALGETLYRLSLTETVTVHVKADVISDTRQTVNIIADTPGGRDDFVVVVGAHLDSVPTGPGIQDNGSGSATILEIALQMAKLEIEPHNKVRFAFWGAEEFGLLGSRHYMEQLSRTERDQIALNLNFDMVASPNFGRFVYDGDHSAFSSADLDVSAPSGSGAIEQIFHNYFNDQDLELEETPFDGRSDYGPFIRNGIPAGGLFTGAEGIKSPGDANIYGGMAGEPYDACYHLPCDTIDNINWQVLDEMADAAAHAVLIFAMTDRTVEETGAQ